MVSMDPGVWVAAILTLCCYSILHKEGPLYRFGESTAIGFGLGYSIIRTLDSLRGMTLLRWQAGNYETIIPVILGILLYSRFVSGYRWLQRPTLAFVVGAGMGISIRGAMHAQFVKQIAGSIVTIPSDPTGAFTWLITSVGTLTVLLYYIFAHLKTKTLDAPRRVGRYLLMIGLGAAFAGGTLTWITDIIVRIQFLVINWLGL